MKKLLFPIVFSSVILFASCGGKQETDNAQLETDISPVIPKINGSVIKVLVEDNQIVEEGDTILLLDDATYKIAVKQAEIAVMTAKQNVELSRSNRGVFSAGVTSVAANSNAVAANMYSTRAGVEAAKVKVDLVTKNYERFRALLDQKSATQQQYDAVKAEKEAAEQQLNIANGQVMALQKQIEASRSQIATTQANVYSSDDGISLAQLSVQQAEANLEAARLQLSYCAILAPSNGVVSKKNVQKGQVVAIGQPLMAIANNQEIWVVANFKETQVEKMKVGQEVEVDVDAYDDKTFKGKVESFSQATGSKFSLLPADNATGNFVKVTQRIPVKILIADNNNEYPLRAGMSVSVTVKTK
ncbi:MAG: HlyD family secretion protein [Gloeobacteraceae cyanobacterium ES-bin-316]|nr:HlyD family secretion protein [Ferruginibacter sp.]